MCNSACQVNLYEPLRTFTNLYEPSRTHTFQRIHFVLIKFFEVCVIAREARAR
jgi:hypothetical protein